MYILFIIAFDLIITTCASIRSNLISSKQTNKAAAAAARRDSITCRSCICQRLFE